MSCCVCWLVLICVVIEQSVKIDLSSLKLKPKEPVADEANDEDIDGLRDEEDGDMNKDGLGGDDKDDAKLGDDGRRRRKKRGRKRGRKRDKAADAAADQEGGVAADADVEDEVGGGDNVGEEEEMDPDQYRIVWYTMERDEERVQLHFSSTGIPSSSEEDAVADGSRVMYFVRTAGGPVLQRLGKDLVGSAAEALDNSMRASIDVGFLCGSVLLSLEMMMSHVFLPWLRKFKPGAQGEILGDRQDPVRLLALSAAMSGDGRRDASVASVGLASAGGRMNKTVGTSSTRVSDALQNEFFAAFSKFVNLIHHSYHEINGKVRLHIPSVRLTPDSYTDGCVVEVIQAACRGWNEEIQMVIEGEQSKRPASMSPVAEIDYWRDRCGSLGSFCEQIYSKPVQRLIEVLKDAGSPEYADIERSCSELRRWYVEAQDNVRFLSTLERHFKSIAHGPIEGIVEVLPSMMGAVRMVWIISRHYHTEERMTALLERVAHFLCDRVSTSVDIRTLFQQDPANVISKIRTARNVLRAWRENVFQRSRGVGAVEPRSAVGL